MKLSGKLAWSLVAVKPITVEKEAAKGSSIILPSGVKAKDENVSLAEFPDHLLQGLVVGVGESVKLCKEGDIVLFMISSDYMAKPSYLNDKGTMYQLFRDSDIVLVREGDGTA